MGRAPDFVLVTFLIVFGTTALFSNLRGDIEVAADRNAAEIHVLEQQDYGKRLNHRVARHVPNSGTRLNCSSKNNVNATVEQHEEPRTMIGKQVADEGAAEDAKVATKTRKERNRCDYQRRRAWMLESQEFREKELARKRAASRRSRERKKALMLESPEFAKKIREQWKNRDKLCRDRRMALILESPEFAKNIREQWKNQSKLSRDRRKALMLESPEFAKEIRERRRAKERRYTERKKALMLNSSGMEEKDGSERMKGEDPEAGSSEQAEALWYKRIKLEIPEVDECPLTEEEWYKQFEMRYPKLAEDLRKNAEEPEEPWNKRIERIKPGEPEAEEDPSEPAEKQWHKRINLSGPSSLTKEEWDRTIELQYSEVAKKQSELNDERNTVTEDSLKAAKLQESSTQTTMQAATPRLINIINNTHIIPTLKVEPV